MTPFADPFADQADLVDLADPTDPADPNRVPTKEEMLQQAIMLEEAALSLAAYSRYVLELEPALHHTLICNTINELLNDEFDDLLICTPPGSAKSTYTSHALSAYYMGAYPNHNVILATHTADLSEKWSRKARNTVTTARHRAVFPTSQLSKDSTAVSRWATTAGGEFLAIGTGASILGFRADLGIIDDPISGFEEAQSNTQLLRLHNWYENDFLTRLKPHGKTVTICQRLAALDLAGYIIARHRSNPTRRLRTLILQMEATAPNPWDDPLGRPPYPHPGSLLWPEWFTPAQLADAKRDEFKWNCLYQQHPPSDSGEWVSPDNILFTDIPPAPTAPTYMAMDLALSMNKGDYTVIFSAQTTPALDLVITDFYRSRSPPEIIADTVLSMIRDYQPLELLIDDDNASKVFAALLARSARTAHTAVPWHPMPLRGQDKETRASSIRGWFRRRKVYFLRSLQPRLGWLFKEIDLFPNAVGVGIDDGVDTLSLFGRRLAQLTPEFVEAPPAHRPTILEMTLDELFKQREQSLSLVFGRGRII